MEEKLSVTELILGKNVSYSTDLDSSSYSKREVPDQTKVPIWSLNVAQGLVNITDAPVKPLIALTV